ncbi:MAG: pilin [Candidatus Magasanikbacteria bacterium]
MKNLDKILYILILLSLSVPKKSLAVEVGISPISEGNTPTSIGGYINSLYNTALGLAAIAAVGLVVIGGFYWSLAGGSKSRMSQAKDYITSALWGFGLLLGAFILLRTINPQLVNLESPSVPKAPVNKAAPLCSSPQGENLSPCGESDPFPYPTSTSAECCRLKGNTRVCNTDLMDSCDTLEDVGESPPSNFDVPGCNQGGAGGCGPDPSPGDSFVGQKGWFSKTLDVEWFENDWKVSKVARWVYYPKKGNPGENGGNLGSSPNRSLKAKCAIYSVYAVPPADAGAEPRWTNKSIDLTGLKRCPGK